LKAKDFAIGQKYIHCLGYSANGLFSAAGNIDGVVTVFDMQSLAPKTRIENH
jgi:hypothetical protein